MAMPTGSDYSLQDLAAVAAVTPRTVRYYIAQGLLPAPDGSGPAARYGESHLARLRLIRQLQREHLPLAAIRARLAELDDGSIAELVAGPSAVSGPTSVIDYVRSLLAGSGRTPRIAQPMQGSPAPAAPMVPAPMMAAPMMAAPPALMRSEAPPATESAPRSETEPALPAGLFGPKPSPPSGPERSQWDRIALTPDIELHVRRPLGRLQNRRVDRLIVIARELLEEDPS
jgi:DNA-binding transcriptional MerR regulator